MRHIETLVLDAQGLSGWIRDDRQVLGILRAAHSMGANVVLCATTVIEVAHATTSAPRLDWILSQVKVIPVTRDAARAAVRLLRQARLSGHTHALDAATAAVALCQAPPVAMVTSDPDDMARLCGDRVRLVRV